MNILSIATELPPHRASTAELREVAKLWLRDAPSDLELFERFLSSSRARARHFVISPRELLTLEGSAIRAALFEREAPRLALAAGHQALQQAGMQAGEVDALIFTSCSCPLIPAVDTYVVDGLGLPRTVLRIPSYQFGCAGGVIGLGLGLHLNERVRNLLLVSAELCSLVFHVANRGPSDLVGAAIFGDGAAAAVLSRDSADGLEVLAAQSYLLPESRHLMGYEIQDRGARLRLDRELPARLVGVIPGIVDEFLASQGVSKANVPWWLFHPGGTKILSTLQAALGLGREQSVWAGEVLSEVGNLSSATILFVIDRFQKSGVSRPGEKALIVGIGPGLTVELILARCR